MATLHQVPQQHHWHRQSSLTSCSRHGYDDWSVILRDVRRTSKTFTAKTARCLFNIVASSVVIIMLPVVWSFSSWSATAAASHSCYPLVFHNTGVPWHTSGWSDHSMWPLLHESSYQLLQSVALAAAPARWAVIDPNQCTYSSSEFSAGLTVLRHSWDSWAKVCDVSERAWLGVNRLMLVSKWRKRESTNWCWPIDVRHSKWRRLPSTWHHNSPTFFW